MKKIILPALCLLGLLISTASFARHCPVPKLSAIGLTQKHNQLIIKNCRVFKRFLWQEYRSRCKVSRKEKNILCRYRKTVVRCEPLAGIVLDYRYCR